VKIHPLLRKAFPDISPDQEKVISHLEGPMLVIAGPGSGKTYSLVLRAMNLLLNEAAKPSEVLLCTFTEKAAFEMRDRLAAAARQTGYDQDLSQLLVGTIHGISNQFLTRFRHHTKLGHNYEALDDLTQLLFVHDKFDQVIGGPGDQDRYLSRWNSRWKAIEGARDYFNKITEELVDPESLVGSAQVFLQGLGSAYTAYQGTLVDANCVDFAHMQRHFYDLLEDDSVGGRIRAGIRFVMVDEYQDTNYIQEQLILSLVRDSMNVCVVGDEDQSLYRFRGATVRNILEFPSRTRGCAQVQLTTNYRSHPTIVKSYDDWMATADWSNPAGAPFRYAKTIIPASGRSGSRYPAVFSIRGKNEADEGRRFADLVSFLMEHGIVDDASHVALLLHSVRSEHSAPYIDALEAKGIRSYCPRARSFFDEQEIRWVVAAMAVILGYFDEGQGETHGFSGQALADYVSKAVGDLARTCASPHPLAVRIQAHKEAVDRLRPEEALDVRLGDLFYDLLACEPFATFLKEENRARRLSICSMLIGVFQSYYHFTVITHANRVPLRFRFFNSFLRLLYEGGINDYEDPDQPFPRGHVQIMTIHQAKGLEFPVVIVGSLDKVLSSPKQIDRELGPFYHRPPFEPENRITGFDRMRLHYVAFSRPQHLLVLTTRDQPKEYFAPIFGELDQWPYVDKEALRGQHFAARHRTPLKKRYSFTGDLRIYETCPRQYEFFRHLDFTPSKSAVIFFGLLVHQTIEDIHRIVLDGGLSPVTEAFVADVFDRTFRTLLLSDVRPPGREAKQAALNQVQNYVRQNRDGMSRIIATEVDVSLEKEGYILSGKVDLLMGGDGKLELLDFKTQPRPDDPRLLHEYERQLCTYGHILEHRHGKRPDRLMVYWTAEEKREDALTVLPYRPERVEEAGRHFDDVVGKIQRREFAVVQPPERKICKECDLRRICASERIIEPFE
jgi:DNA helicase-2/ATP-dependent DNA helicase PcrA